MVSATMTEQKRHSTWTQSYKERANLSGTPALTAYLLRLIAIKRTNLCVSADVTNSDELIRIANDVGDYICILKTHCDIVSDWGERTVQQLRKIARRKRFLIFEDRKFADIGETVRKQYTGGRYQIARWSEITNAHILPGPAIITSLKQGASQATSSFHSGVSTDISADIPPATWHNEDSQSEPEPPSPYAVNSESPVYFTAHDKYGARNGRKASIVSVSTTISQRADAISPHPPTPEQLEETDVLQRLGEAPIERALLLLAEMSSEGHLMTPEYSQRCVELARQQKDFVMGFIAQRSLNTEPGDNFLTMTPGVQLPKPGSEEKMGDSQGQQYNTPRKIILEQGCDVAIVGRGIIMAENIREAAKRYRDEAWDAYEERIGVKY